jgi:hypothetical protein
VWPRRARRGRSDQLTVALHDLHCAVVVTMIAVRVMQPPIHEIVDMVAMGNRFMTAARSVGVACAADVRRALHWIAGGHAEHVFVYVIAVHVVQVPVMQVIDVTFVSDRRVSAARPVLMTMIGVVGQVACGHDFLLLIE